MADNTRKTSNIIHDLAEVKDDVSNNSQNITNLSQNLTTLDGEAIKKINGVVPNDAGNIALAEGDNIEIVENTANNNLTISANLSGYAPTSSLYDKAINLSASNGVEVTQNGNTSGNNQSDKEWKLQANYTEIKDNINLALNDLSDVSNTSVSNGQVLTYNGSMWTAANSTGGGNITGGVTSLNGEDGVINITSANNTLNVNVDNATDPKTINLELNGTIPSVPSNIVETVNNLSGNLTLESSNGTIGIAQNGTDKINLTLNASLNDLKNVSTGTPSDNQVLTWNGSNWTSQNASGGTFKTINSIQPDDNGNFGIINGTGISISNGPNNLTLNCTVQNTDTGIVSLKSGVATVDGGEARQVEFESSDSSVQFALSGGNKIDLTVPAAGLNIKGSVDYAEPQTEADGTYTDGNGEVHEVLWLPSQYLEAASGVDNPALGDLYIVQYEGSAASGPPPGTDFYGHGYVFALKSDGSGDYEWSDAGRISGPPGQDGTSISLEEDVTVNSDATILTSTGKFSTTANPGEYELTLNIAPSDVTVGDLNELSDVCDTDPTDKQVLAWDNTNSKWCPANATAAAALPISSVDGEVVLSDSSGSFVVSTGGEERLTVDGKGQISQAIDSVSNGIANGQAITATDTAITNQFGNYISFVSTATGGLHNGTWTGNYVHTASLTQSLKELRGFSVNDQPASVMSASALYSSINTRAGKDRYAINAAGSAPSYFGGDIQTPSISGLNSNDASVTLGASFVVSTGNPSEARLTVRADGNIGQGYGGQENINYAIYQGFGTSTQEQIGFLSSPKFDGQPATRCVGVESQPLFTDVVANNVLHFSANDARAGNKSFASRQVGFLSNDLDKSTVLNIGFESGQTGANNFAFLASGSSPSQFNGSVLTPSVSGPNNNDASVALGASFIVSTGGTESFKIAANKYATFEGHVGVMGAAFSTASVALQGEVKPVNAGGAFGLWVSATYVVDPDATYEKHARAFASVKAPANGQAFDTFTQFYASGVCGNDVKQNFGVYAAVSGAINNIGCCVTSGGIVKDGNWGFYDNTNYLSYFQGGVLTPSISGVADDSASVTLGSNFVVSTGGETRATFGKTENTLLSLNGCAGWTAATQYGCVVNPTTSAETTSFYAYRSSPNLTTKTGTLQHFAAFGRTDVPEQYGFYYGVSSSPPAKVGDVGFRANKAGANYAFYADQTGVPSYFAGKIQTPSVSGTADNDASVTLGSSFKAEVGIASYQMLSNGFHLFQSDGSQSRFTNDGKFLVNTSTTDAGYQSTFLQNNNGETGLVRFVTNNSDGTCNLYVDCDPSDSTVTLSTSNNFEIKANQATLTKGDGSEYVPSADQSLVTKKWVTDVLSGGIGDDNSQLPGNGSNFIWQKVQIWQPSRIGNVNQTNVQRYYRVLAFDGIFTDGLHWTTDGEDWRTAAQSERNGLFTTANDGDRIVKSYAENLYVYGNYFSYNMKQWNTSFFGGYKDTFYFDGHVFSYAGGIYFDPTKPGAESTLALYGKSPTVPDGINGLGSKWGPSTGEPEGTVAFSLAESDTTRKNVLMLLRADETQDADWGWHQIDLPNGDEPLNVLYAPDKDSTPSFFVFCGQSVHVSPVSDPTNFTTYALPVASNWDLVCFDGTSITSASTSSDVSIFSSDGGETWDTSNNFYNLSTSVSQMALAGTNGRTIYSISTGESTATDEETGVETKYSITEYLRSGVGTIGDENQTIIIGGGSLVQTDGVSLTEPIDTSENNTASGFPTWRAAADADYDLAPEPALLKTQEETNSYFNNKISITRHDQNDLKEAVSGNTDEIAKNTGLASDAMNLAGAALATANSKTETVVLTQAEYDLLSPPDPMILYLIT